MKKFILSFLMLVSILAQASDKLEETGYKNALLWNTLYVSQGVFSFTYEHYVTPSSALQVGIGVTQENFAKYTSVDFVLEYPTLSTESNRDSYTPGLSGLLGYKKFIKESAKGKGFYVNPQYRFRNYNYSTDYQSNATDFDYSTSLNRFENINEIGCTFGYQTGGYIMFNFFIGGAYMIKQYQDVNRTQTMSLDPDPSAILIYEYQTKKRTSVSPMPWAGLSVGFMF